MELPDLRHHRPGAGAIGFLGYLFGNTIQQASGVEIPWWIFALATFALGWVLTHFGIRLSLRTTVIFGAIELLIMLALAITFLVQPGRYCRTPSNT